MNFSEIQNAVKHLKKTCKCVQCNNKFHSEDINVVASTQQEGLFELRCFHCGFSTIVTVMLSPEITTKEGKNYVNSSQESSVSENDILDIKNFLLEFDGNFKKLFKK